MPLDPNWDPDEARRLLNSDLEKAVYDGESDAETAKRVLKEAAPVAAARLVNLALHSMNERISLQAATYIIDRNLGRISDGSSTKSEMDDALMNLVKDITSAVPGIKE